MIPIPPDVKTAMAADYGLTLEALTHLGGTQPEIRASWKHMILSEAQVF